MKRSALTIIVVTGILGCFLISSSLYGEVATRALKVKVAPDTVGMPGNTGITSVPIQYARIRSTGYRSLKKQPSSC